MGLEQLIFPALGLGLPSAVLFVGAVVFVFVRLMLIVNIFHLIDNVQYRPFYLLMCNVFILLIMCHCVHFI